MCVCVCVCVCVCEVVGVCVCACSEYRHRNHMLCVHCAHLNVQSLKQSAQDFNLIPQGYSCASMCVCVDLRHVYHFYHIYHVYLVQSPQDYDRPDTGAFYLSS